LFHQDDTVQCAAASTFSFFFEQEEAVTQRKKLAIAPLVKLLSTASARAQVCAINALAEAENKRALLPLLTLTTASHATPVRIAAIRALGLIRDGSAQQPLLELLKNLDSQDPQVTATLLIALKRLKTSTLHQQMTDLFNQKLSQTALLHRYKILSSLFNDNDGIVFAKTELNKLVQLLMHHNRLPTHLATKAAQADIGQLSAALQTIGAGQLIDQFGRLKQLTTVDNKAIAEQALTAIARLNSQQAHRYFERVVLQQPYPQLKKSIAIGSNMGDGIEFTFSSTFITQLASKSQGLSANQLSGLLDILPTAAASRLMAQSLTTDLTEPQSVALLNQCFALGLQLNQPDPVFWQHPSVAIRRSYIRCLFNQTDTSTITSTITSTSTLSTLTKRRIIKSVLADSQWDQPSKTAILLTAAATDPFIADNMLATALFVAA
jgi:hypothetical protein